MLKKKSVKHNVLNAVNHEAEATIIAQAGRLGAVTIATNMAGRGTDILLGGNPDFLARSDMENEWISRAAKLPVGGAGRYEDALRELREKYEEEVQKAEKRYLKDGELYEQQRSDALKRSTEIQRQVRELSPFRDKRERYEDLSATEFIEALHGMRPIPESYLQAKQDLETSLLQVRDGNDGDSNEAFEEARQDFSDCINRWQQQNGARQELLETLDEKRRNYEQRANDFEFNRALLVLGRGDHAALVAEYGKVYQAFEEAETTMRRASAALRKSYSRGTTKLRNQAPGIPAGGRGDSRAIGQSAR